MEAGLANLAERACEATGKDVSGIPGGGAAGGLAAGAAVFMNADLASGADAVMQAIGLEEALRGTAWVITGEGKFDHQSLGGKVVSGVARLARKHGVRVAVLAGSVQLSEDAWRAAGIEAALGTKPDTMPLEEAMTNAAELLHTAAVRLAEEDLS